MVIFICDKIHSIGEGDIALILLDESVDNYVYKSDKIWPACLPSSNLSLQTGNMSLVSCWGSTQPMDIDNSKANK